MSNRAMAARYSQASGANHQGGGASPYPWIRRREANEEQQRQIQMIQLIHQLGLEDTRTEGEESRKTDKAKSQNTIDEELSKHYGMTPEDAKALSPKVKTILSNKMDAEIASQTGKPSGLDTGFQSATDFGTRAGAAGINPNSLIKDLPANSLSTLPNIPGLTGPLNTGMGIQTIKGPNETRKVTEEGGFPMEMPPGSGKFVNIGGKPATYSEVSGGGEASYPINPAIKLKAMQSNNEVTDDTELNAVNGGVMKNTTGPASSQLSTGSEYNGPKFMFSNPALSGGSNGGIDDILKLMQMLGASGSMGPNVY